MNIVGRTPDVEVETTLQGHITYMSVATSDIDVDKFRLWLSDQIARSGEGEHEAIYQQDGHPDATVKFKTFITSITYNPLQHD